MATLKGFFLPPPVQRVHLEQRQDNVFSVVTEVEDKSVFWGELFTEKERTVLRKHLESTEVNFPIKERYQINLRALWTPDMRELKDRQASSGRTVFCLHGLEGKATSSWAWVKLALSLYRRGISSVMFDWPGYGASPTAGKPEDWVQLDWRILGEVLRALKVSAPVIVAHGRACGAVLRLAGNTQGLLGREMHFHNPMFLLSEVTYSEAAAPGSGEQGFLKVRKKQQLALERSLQVGEHRIWVTHGYPGGVAAAGKAAKEALAALTAATGGTFPRVEAVTEVSERHICEAQVGAQVPVHAFLLSKAFKRLIVGFLEGQPPPTQSPLPDPTVESEVESTFPGSSLPSLASSRAPSLSGSAPPTPGSASGPRIPTAEAANPRRAAQGWAVPKVASLSGSVSLPLLETSSTFRNLFGGSPFRDTGSTFFEAAGSLREAAAADCVSRAGSSDFGDPEHSEQPSYGDLAARWLPMAEASGRLKGFEAPRNRVVALSRLPRQVHQAMYRMDRIDEAEGSLDLAAQRAALLPEPDRRILERALAVPGELEAAREDRRKRVEAVKKQIAATGNHYVRRRLQALLG